MKFQHILLKSVEGTRLFGLDPEPLHSKTIDRDMLKKWVDTLSKVLSSADGGEEKPSIGLSDKFCYELQAYCLYIASSDGAITDDTLEDINWLVGNRLLNLNSAIGLLNDIDSAGWLERYPVSFKTLVWIAAGKNKDIALASEIYHFYHQVARFVFSIEHSDEFDEKSSAREYVDSYKKYIERVSVSGFEYLSAGESSISDVCKEWDKLIDAERAELEAGMVGGWEGVTGDALSSGVLSDFFLADNGFGLMGKELLLTWKIVDVSELNAQVPVIGFLNRRTSVIMLPITPDIMRAIVLSDDPSSTPKGALFRRKPSDKKSEATATAEAPKKTDSSTRTAPTAKKVVQTQPTTSAGEIKSGSKTGKRIAILTVALIVLSLFAYGIASKPGRDYEKAMGYYNAGMYQAAADGFAELGDYEDSNKMMQEALLGVAAQKAEEEAGEDSDAWEAAAQAYEQMGKGKGKSEAAYCHNYSAYYKGKELMSEGSWKKAKKAFDGISVEDFEDAAVLSEECDIHIAYDEAEALLEGGSNYEAYVRFQALDGLVADRNIDGLPDISERMQACVQDMPATGVLYTNPDFSSTAVPLTISNSGGDSYYRLYNGDNLAIAFFIRSGDTLRITLPAGSYHMNQANGKQWFGDTDMFGKSGSYYQCVFGGKSTADLENGYEYTIQTSSIFRPDSTGITNEEIDMDDF